jgi:hypothetical protein
VVLLVEAVVDKELVYKVVEEEEDSCLCYLLVDEKREGTYVLRQSPYAL